MAGRGNSERCDDSMCFFFSSRRRHTRFDCDWSSDVCSSDLCKYVSNKVIVAKMFCTQPVCVVFDAQAKQDHGSHVSGIAAGVANTCAPFVGCKIGRAACRERGEISVGAGSFKKKKKYKSVVV